ncbi:MAG: glycosyltransferase family 2 protein [Porticoccaceae bacterium]
MVTESNASLISVVLPVYQGEAYVEESIRSILNQTYKNIELIVVDDGSTDNTARILFNLGAEDSRIRIISTPNRGVISALNTGVGYCAGEYIARMDADDISLNDRFEKQLDFLRKGRFNLVGGSINRVYGVTNRVKNYPEKNEELKASILSFGPSVAHPAMLGEAQIFKAYEYNLADKYCEDYGLLARLALDSNCRIGNYPGVVLNYRVHKAQITSNNTLSEREDGCADALYRVLVERFCNTKPEMLSALYSIMKKKNKNVPKKYAEDLLVLMKIYMKAECLDKKIRQSLIARVVKKIAWPSSLDRINLLLRLIRIGRL